MAITVISSENVTVSGNITIPDTCTLVLALVYGSETPPIINGLNMIKVASTPAVGALPAVSIHQYQSPLMLMTLPFLMTGTYVRFVYLANAVTFRPGVLFGYSSVGSYTFDLTTTTNDMAFGIVSGFTSVDMKGDTVALTYMDNNATNKTGYITPGDTALTCLATDGSSSGYWQSQSPVYHPSVLIRAAWVENLTAIYHTYAYRYYSAPYYYWTEYRNGVYYRDFYDSFLSHTSWTEYPQIYHPATYSSEYWSYPPPIWISTGTAGQCNACFVSISLTASGGFISRPIIF
jgi:hypothetical protein